MTKNMFGVGTLALTLAATSGAFAQQRQFRQASRPQQEQSRQPARHKVPNGTEVWRIVTHIKDGKRAKADVNSVGLVYDGKNFEMVLGRTRMSGRYHLNTRTTPHQIDMTLTSQSGKSVSIEGIYKEKGDKLEVCYAPPGKARPTAFSSRLGSGDRLYVYQHTKTVQTAQKQAKQPVALGSKGFAPQSFAATGPTGAAATQLISPITAVKENPGFAGALIGAAAGIIAAPIAIAAAPVVAAVGEGAADIAAGISEADLAGATELSPDLSIDADGTLINFGTAQ